MTKNSLDLKIKIADEIIVVNKYILLILHERREKITDIYHVFDKKVFLTALFSKITMGPTEEDVDQALIPLLKQKLSDIMESDGVITSILTERKSEMGKKISMLEKISNAIKAYGVNNPT